ncbi:MAG: GntR family transcriptional regulator [Parabacteroides sp.]|nr:GntR family transcriptional regulator [Parabacteroides sp.]MCD8270921.1 GntR family transcriptional regulator [Parabacteroides sp.]
MADVLVKSGVSKKLQERFGVSAPTVRKALRGITRSELANRIRQVAIKEFGGRADKTERVIIYK